MADGIGRGAGTLIGNNYSGTAPGYAVVNMNLRYNFGDGWAGSLLVNNVLDKKYYTAGRLGISPFSPSINGAIGPSGFNYNSNEWMASQFISAGAPRGLWASLSYDFDASKKGQVPADNIMLIEPDTSDAKTTPRLNAEEVALIKELDTLQALPITQRLPTGVEMAKQQVKVSIANWQEALTKQNIEAYINSYADNFAPSQLSHNSWVEEQKIKLATDPVQITEVGDIVVAPLGKTFVAVFTQTISKGGKAEATRKVLTFGQQAGQWKIMRERNTAPSNLSADSAALKTSTTSTPEISENLKKQKQIVNSNVNISRLEVVGARND